MEKLTEYDKEKMLVSILLRRRKDRSAITYTDLSKKAKKEFGVDVNHHLGWSKALFNVNKICADNGWPILGGMVVNEVSWEPGAGFYNSYDECYPEKKHLPKKEKSRLAQKEFLEFDDYQQLVDLYSLEIDFDEDDDEFSSFKHYTEGARKQSSPLATKAERDPKARAKCLRLFGTSCKVCGFDSQREIGIPGIIDVHHIVPLSLIDGEHEVDPEDDLIPVCPNCHRALYSKEGKGCYTIEELKEIRASNNQ